jgi:hypothetical protein
MKFESGGRESLQEFTARTPALLPAFQRLDALAETVFAQQSAFGSPSEQICFALGHTCWEDFNAIFCLSFHGHENSAFQLVGGLYERALALAYIVAHPEKAERFLQFDLVRDNETMDAALKCITETWATRGLHRGRIGKRIRERFSALETELKSKFEITDCENCKTKRLDDKWDIDVASMAVSIGYPYEEFYVAAYVSPKLAVHNTILTMLGGKRWTRGCASRNSILLSTDIFFTVLQQQNRLFRLDVDAEITNCHRQMLVAFEQVDDLYPRNYLNI